MNFYVNSVNNYNIYVTVIVILDTINKFSPASDLVLFFIIKKNQITVLFGANVDLLWSYAISGPCERQHLNAVVSEFLQAIQLERRQQRGDVSDLPKFWKIGHNPYK